MRSTLLFFLVVLCACSESPINVIPGYKPAELNPYSVETFEREWQKTKGLEVNEVTVLQDLLARHSSSFEWSLFWGAFSSGRISAPTSAGAWEVLLQDNFVKCSPQTRDSYAAFAVMDFSAQEGLKRNLLLVDKLLPPSCSIPLSLKVRKSVVNLFNKNPSAFPRGSKMQRHQDRELMRTLEAPGESFETRPEWEQYLESRLQEPTRASAEFAGLMSAVDLSDSKIDPTRKTSVEIVLEKSLTWDLAIVEKLVPRLGIKSVVGLLRERKPAFEFARLSKEERRLFLSELQKIITEANAEGWVCGLFLITEYLNAVNVREALEHLPVLDELISRISVKALNSGAAIQMNLISQIDERVELPGLQSWLLLRLNPNTFGARLRVVEKLNRLDDVFLSRTALRLSVADPRYYRIQLQNICNAWAELGFPLRPFDSQSDDFASERGCLRLSEPSDLQLKIESSFSADLVLLTEGRDISITVAPGVTDVLVDASPDSLMRFPAVPEVLSSRPEDAAIIFPVILGLASGDKIIHYPFHFEARRQQLPLDPVLYKRGNSDPTPSRNGGKITVTAETGDIDFVGVVSNGSFAEAGLPPSMGGLGDRSKTIARSAAIKFVSKVNTDRREQGNLQHLEYIPYPTHHDLRSLVQAFKSQEALGQKHFVTVDKELMKLLAPHDREQFESYLKSIVQSADLNVLRLYCENLNADSAYRALRGLGGNVSDQICGEVFALDTLAGQAYLQLSNLVAREDWTDQTSFDSDWILPDLGMSSPGIPPVSGSGGAITLTADSVDKIWTSAQPGERYRWPKEWASDDRNGSSGVAGPIEILNRKERR